MCIKTRANSKGVTNNYITQKTADMKKIVKICICKKMRKIYLFIDFPFSSSHILLVYFCSFGLVFNILPFNLFFSFCWVTNYPVIRVTMKIKKKIKIQDENTPNVIEKHDDVVIVLILTSQQNES